MRTLPTIAFLSILLLGLSSCRKDQCKDGDEYPRGAIRTLAPFTAINVNLSAIVELIQDTTHYVELVVEENLETHLATRIINDTLDLSLGFCFNNHAEILIKVHFDSLNTISIDGPGDIVSKSKLSQNDLTLNIRSSGDMDLTTDIKNLITNINGTGIVTLNGQVHHHLIHHNGSGSVNTYQAMTDSVIVNLNNTGGVYVRVKNSLTATISNSGNIYYKGRPTLTNNITGSGEVISEN